MPWEPNQTRHMYHRPTPRPSQGRTAHGGAEGRQGAIGRRGTAQASGTREGRPSGGGPGRRRGQPQGGGGARAIAPPPRCRGSRQRGAGSAPAALGQALGAGRAAAAVGRQGAAAIGAGVGRGAVYRAAARYTRAPPAAPCGVCSKVAARARRRGRLRRQEEGRCSPPCWTAGPAASAGRAPRIDYTAVALATGNTTCRHGASRAEGRWRRRCSRCRRHASLPCAARHSACGRGRMARCVMPCSGGSPLGLGSIEHDPLLHWLAAPQTRTRCVVGRCVDRGGAPGR
jgi:hypothetical protein